MTSIHLLYEKTEVGQGQRGKFWERVQLLLSSSANKMEIGNESIRYLRERFDLGGISAGRSLRSLLLNKAEFWIETRDLVRSGEIIAVLVAMYHNHEYIERSDWYDYPLDFGLYGSSVGERIHLAVVAHVLGVEDKIPDITGFCDDDFLSLLKG